MVVNIKVLSSPFKFFDDRLPGSRSERAVLLTEVKTNLRDIERARKVLDAIEECLVNADMRSQVCRLQLVVLRKPQKARNHLTHKTRIERQSYSIYT